MEFHFFRGLFFSRDRKPIAPKGFPFFRRHQHQEIRHGEEVLPRAGEHFAEAVVDEERAEVPVDADGVLGVFHNDAVTFLAFPESPGPMFANLALAVQRGGFLENGLVESPVPDQEPQRQQTSSGGDPRQGKEPFSVVQQVAEPAPVDAAQFLWGQAIKPFLNEGQRRCVAFVDCPVEKAGVERGGSAEMVVDSSLVEQMERGGLVHDKKNHVPRGGGVHDLLVAVKFCQMGDPRAPEHVCGVIPPLHRHAEVGKGRHVGNSRKVPVKEDRHVEVGVGRGEVEKRFSFSGTEHGVEDVEISGAHTAQSLAPVHGEEIHGKAHALLPQVPLVHKDALKISPGIPEDVGGVALVQGHSERSGPLTDFWRVFLGKDFRAQPSQERPQQRQGAQEPELGGAGARVRHRGLLCRVRPTPSGWGVGLWGQRARGAQTTGPRRRARGRKILSRTWWTDSTTDYFKKCRRSLKRRRKISGHSPCPVEWGLFPVGSTDVGRCTRAPRRGAWTTACCGVFRDRKHAGTAGHKEFPQDQRGKVGNWSPSFPLG